MRLIWSDLALDDLKKIRKDITPLNPHAAKRVSAAIRATARRLRRFPYLGHEGEEGTRELLVVRYPSYLLIYDVDSAASLVTVLTVWKQWLP